jgi:type VI secretion system secreted protein Hcp
MSYTALLKIDGIKGDADIESHKGEIEVLAVSHGVQAPRKLTGPQQSASVADHKDQDLVVTSTMGIGSPKLFEAAVTGKHFPKAVVTFLSVSPSGKVSEFMIITMSDVVVSSIVPVAHDTYANSEPAPMQDMTLNYGKIEWEFKPIEEAKSTGPVKTSWDLKSGK